MSKHLELAESSPEVLTIRFNNPDGTTMTPALVNAIRRVILAETPSMSLGLKNNRMIINTSAFNTDYLRDRLALVPVYQKKFNHLKPYVDDIEFGEDYDEEAYDKAEFSDEDVEEYEPESNEKEQVDVKLLFRICDPNDWSKSLKNSNPEPLKVTVNKHLLLLKKKPEHLNLKFTLNQLSVDPSQTEIATDIEVVDGSTADVEKEKQKSLLAQKNKQIDSSEKQKGGAKPETEKTPTEKTPTSESAPTEKTPTEKTPTSESASSESTTSESSTSESTSKPMTNKNTPTETTEVDDQDGSENLSSDDDFESTDDEFNDAELRVDEDEELREKEEARAASKSKSQLLDEPPSEGKYLTTHEDWTTYYELVSEKEFKEWMKYDFYLLMLKPTEEILHNIVPSIEIGREHCTFAPCTIAGYYFGNQARPINPGKFARAKQYSEYPAQISLSLESNGHYPNKVIMEEALSILNKKIRDFETEVLHSIDSEPVVYDFEESAKPVINLTKRYFQEQDRLRANENGAQSKEIQALMEQEKENYLVLKVNYEDQTLGQLVAIYGALFFHELYKAEPIERQTTLLQNSFCGFRRPSPLEHEIQISIKTPNKKLWPEQFNQDHVSLSRPMQVLTKILDQIDKLLEEVTMEFKTLSIE